MYNYKHKQGFQNIMNALRAVFFKSIIPYITEVQESIQFT